MSTQIDEPQTQPTSPSKAPWETPTIEEFSIDEKTKGGGGTGPDGTAGPMLS